MQPTNDLRVVSNRRLTAPAVLKTELPMGEQANATVVGGRATVQRILRREDPRLLVVIGPCSIHDPESAMEYARRLLALDHQHLLAPCGKAERGGKAPHSGPDDDDAIP